MGLLTEDQKQPAVSQPVQQQQQVQNPVQGPVTNQSLYNIQGDKTKTPTDLMMVAPNLRNVDPEKETVQGQLKGIMESDSPLMQLGKRTGLEQAQRRGLLNSSLAAEAAQVGVMREARPIAEQDAAAYLKQGMTNQQYENQFLGNVQESGLQNWLATAQDTRAAQEAQREFARKRQLMSEEYGFKAEETAGKQNAALWAQFVQASGEINKADMKVEDKARQIETLRQATLTGMAANAKHFNDPEMMTFLTRQMGSVANAVKTAPLAIPGMSTHTAFKIPTGAASGMNQIQQDRYFRTHRIDPNKTYRLGEKPPPGYGWGIDPNTGQMGLVKLPG